jgi:uncharacterized small protein (DUF1192 family)
MLMEDLDPPQKKDADFKKLDTLSVAALEEYIMDLEKEILRAREEIKHRGKARSAAEALFAAKDPD